MATKNDLVRTLKRTGELARKMGFLETDESLALSEADRQSGEPWGVLLVQTLEDGSERRRSSNLPWLPDSGRSIGRTKSEAQEALQTINGVLVVAVERKALM